eukprot:3936493-Rhodomonas_salina.5
MVISKSDFCQTETVFSTLKRDWETQLEEQPKNGQWSSGVGRLKKAMLVNLRHGAGQELNIQLCFAGPFLTHFVDSLAITS